jgi:hypothetical protein
MLSAQQWNIFLARRRRNRFSGFTTRPGRDHRHAWKITPSFEQEAWHIRIRPGYVNAKSATVDTDDGETKLTDFPLWRLGAFRAIGPSAQPIALNDAGDSIRFVYEEVPEYFRRLGVGEPPTINGVTLERVTTGEDEKRRLLMATEVVLYQDHPATVGVVEINDGTTGAVITVNAQDLDATRLKKRAYLRQTSVYTPPGAPVDPFTAATEGWSDAPRTERHLATIWFVSQEGAALDTPPDASWTPHIKHRHKFNFEHGLDKITEPLKNEPLTLNTALAGGVANPVNQFLLAQVNDANSALARFFDARRRTGKFHTV